MLKISLCVPCYNEEKNIEAMYTALKVQMKPLKKYDYEIIFADNASTDGSEAILRKLAESDCQVKVILNNRNFGPTRSGLNMINRTSGDAVIIIPCDFQEPPDMIPVFIEEWEKGNLVVWGQKKRSSENKIMFAIRTAYYYIYDKISDIKQYKHVTGFGLTDRKVLEEIKKVQDIDRGLRSYILEMGYPIKLIPYQQNIRKEGKSSYNFSRYYDLALRNFFQSSNMPLKKLLNIGIGAFLGSFIWFFYALIQFITKGNLLNIIVNLQFSIMSLLISFNLIAIGIIGQYLCQIVSRVIKVPLVIEKELINFN